MGSGYVKSDKDYFYAALAGDDRFVMHEFTVDQSTYLDAISYMAVYDDKFDYSLYTNNCTHAAFRSLDYAGLVSSKIGYGGFSPDEIAYKLEALKK